jgi:hypothetical protein
MAKALKQTIEFDDGTFTLNVGKKEKTEFTVDSESVSGFIENIKIIQDLSFHENDWLAIWYDYDGLTKSPKNKMQAKRSIRGTFRLANSSKLEVLGNQDLSTQVLDIEIESLPDAEYDKWMANRQADVNCNQWKEYQKLWLSSDTTSRLSFYPEEDTPAIWCIMTHLKESLFDSLCEEINKNCIQSILCHYKFPLATKETAADKFWIDVGKERRRYLVPPGCHEENGIEIFDTNTSTRVFGYLDRIHFTEYEEKIQPLKYSDEQIEEALDTLLETDGNTQFGEIATELLKNEFDNSKYSINGIKNLLHALKCSYQNSDVTSQGLEPLFLHKDDFEIFVNKLSDEKKEKAISLHKTFWHHAEFINLMRSGKLHKPEYYALDVWALEDAARIYLNNQWMHSETLEWLLVDALMFSETASFARVATKPPTIFNLSILPILKELFYLGLTAFVSALFSSQKTGADVIFWIIFSVITIIRWLNPYQADKNKPQKLAAEMMGVYEELKRMDFNPKVLQMLLFDLEKKGAYYSPMIYKILDKKIANNN